MPFQTLEIATDDGPRSVGLHTPAGDGPWPGVILQADESDTAPVARDIAERLASAGYAVLTPEPNGAASVARPFSMSSPGVPGVGSSVLLGLLHNVARIGVPLATPRETPEEIRLRLEQRRATLHGVTTDETKDHLQKVLAEAGVELSVDP